MIGDILAMGIVGLVLGSIVVLVAGVSWIGHVRQRQRETERMYHYITGQCTASRQKPPPTSSQYQYYTADEEARYRAEAEAWKVARERIQGMAPMTDEEARQVARDAVQQFEEMVNGGRK